MSDPIKRPAEDSLRLLEPSSIAVYAMRCASRIQPFLTLPLAKTQRSVQFIKAILKVHNFCSILLHDVTKLNDEFLEAVEYVNTHVTQLSEETSNLPRVDLLATSNAAAAFNNLAQTLYTSNVEYTPGIFTIESTNSLVTAARLTAKVGAGVTLKEHAEEEYNHACLEDFVRLKELKDVVTDASETGPLGDLWYGSPPDWYVKAKERYEKTIAEWERELAEEKDETRKISGSAKIGISASAKLTGLISDDTAFPIEFYIDPGDAQKETIQNVLECLSDLHIAAGGFGLEFIADDLNIKAMEGVTK